MINADEETQTIIFACDIARGISQSLLNYYIQEELVDIAGYMTDRCNEIEEVLYAHIWRN